MLVPLLGPERIVFVPRRGHAGEQDRPLLDRAELVEVSDLYCGFYNDSIGIALSGSLWHKSLWGISGNKVK
jgi:hypothetical protein